MDNFFIKKYHCVNIIKQLRVISNLLIKEDKIRDEWEENIITYLDKINYHGDIYEQEIICGIHNCYNNANHHSKMHSLYMKMYENALCANYEAVESIRNLIRCRKIALYLLSAV